MTKRTRQWLTAALIAAILIAIAWDRIPLSDAQDRLAKLPLSGPGFAGTDIPLTDGEAAVFGAAKVIKRLYQVGREQILVVVIDGTFNRHAIHDPTYCFRGAGWSVSSEEAATVPGGAASHVQLANGGQKREALYWITDGATRHSSPTRYWRQTALRRLSLGKSGAEPVLVVVQPNQAGAHSLDLLTSSLPALFQF